MKRFITQFFVCVIALLGLSIHAIAQDKPETVAIKGILIRTTPKLTDIDKTTMYGQPLVKTRDENGRIRARGLREAKQALDREMRERFQKQYDEAISQGLAAPANQDVPNSINIPTSTIPVNFDGQTSPGLQPTDNNMAAGPNHIIQAVNNTSGTQFTIYNKAGVVVAGPTIFASLSGVPGDGDPIVLYDQLADRWFIGEFGGVGGTNSLIMAISATPNPTGAWNVYTFTDNSFFPDYPKWAVWHNAFYAYTNDFTPPGVAPFLGTSVWAFDRAAMIAGAGTAASVRQRINIPNMIAMGVVNLDGVVPSTQNGLFVVPTSATQLGVFEVTPNFGASTITVGAVSNFAVNTFGAIGNIPQQTGSGLGSLSPRMMFRVGYRNNGGTESIVAAHTIANGGLGGVRWYELRRTAGVWGVHQQGNVFGTDGNSRWMPGIAMDACGNIALMYDVAGTGTPAAHPSIRYTGRNASDPLNTMTLPEAVIINAATNFGGFRWGDYNTTVPDYLAAGVPNNGSFWTTSQYGNQLTRIANFTLTGGCAPAPNVTIAGYTLDAESCAPANGVIDPGETVTITLNLQNVGNAPTVNAVATLQATGGVTPIAPVSQNYGVLVDGGPAVGRQFTFSNTSTTCGGTITVSVQVQDGSSNLGTISLSPITLGTTANQLVENFDGVVAPALPAGWTTTFAGVSGSAWVTSTTTPQSAPNAAFTNDPSNIADNNLITPSFVPQPGARVTFRNNFNLENGFDGGVLEISINGGAFNDIITAGGSWVAGGYNGNITTTNFGSPIQGRPAWTGNSGGYITSTANLPPTGGQPVRLRFRMGSDNLIAGTGWRVDDVVVQSPVCCGPPCVLTCPANITVGAAAGQCGANVTYPAATATGLCGPISYSRASGSFFPVGTTTVNVSSASGATCSFTVTVTDNVPPTITCPANITVSNAAGQCGASVSYSLPTVSDNCPQPVQIPASFNNHGSGGVFTLGGNTAPGGYFFSVTNTTGTTRVISNFGIRFGNPAFGAVAAPQTLTVWSRSGGLTAAIENSATGWTQQGPQVVNPIPPYFATGTGPLGTCNLSTAVSLAPGATASFYIHGVTACPVFSGTVGAITPPASVGGFTLTGGSASANALGAGGIFQQGVTNVIPNISIRYTEGLTLTQIAGLPSGSTFPVGVTTNTFQATDGAGNTATCSFNVTVNDTELPVFTTCPAAVTRNTDAGQCYATYTPVQPVFTDNCAVTQLTWAMTGATTGSSPGAGINYVPSTQFGLTGTTGVGVTTITYTARDAAGNTRTCVQTVTVNDASIPVITTQPATKFVCVGSDAVFSVVASAGAGNPLAYQWQQWNGSAWVNIAGATASSYTIPAVTFAQNTNSYRVILTGRCSVVTSNFATLYINPLPTVTLVTSIPPAILPGQSLNISSTVSLAGGTYAWYRNGTLLTSPLAQGPVLSGLTVDDLGTYRLVYTDPNGCVGTSADVVVTGLASDNLWVYPVPNNGTFQVRFFNQANESATIRVFDEKGAKVYERAVVTNLAYTRMDVVLGPATADGTYVVELINSSGKRVGAKKIVVRKKP